MVPLESWARYRVARLSMGVEARTLPFVQRTPEQAVELFFALAEAVDCPIDLEEKGGSQRESFARTLARELPRKARKLIAANAAELRGKEVAVKSWCRAAHASSSRAGLLVAGEIRVALEATLAQGITPESVRSSEEASDLVWFGISSTAIALRRKLGLLE